MRWGPGTPPPPSTGCTHPRVTTTAAPNATEDEPSPSGPPLTTPRPAAHHSGAHARRQLPHHPLSPPRRARRRARRQNSPGHDRRHARPFACQRRQRLACSYTGLRAHTPSPPVHVAAGLAPSLLAAPPPACSPRCPLARLHDYSPACPAYPLRAHSPACLPVLPPLLRLHDR